MEKVGFWENTNENLWSDVTGSMAGVDYASRYTWLIIGICIAYFPLIWFLQQLMKSRPPMKLKWISFMWNMGLSILSGIGAAIFLIYDPKCLITLEVHESKLHKKIYYVIVIFCLTKWIEFGDTILLILKKKPLLFLHVYHHFTVALYGWHSQTVSIHFRHHLTFINLSIHFIMYFYYALVSIIPRNPLLKSSRSYITMIQTIQMFFGIWVSWISIQSNELQNQAKLNVLYALVMYVSYAYLFVMFYLQNYVAGVRSSMTIVLGTVHAGALMGAAKLWYHQQWNLLMLELLIGYIFTVIVLKNFSLPFGTLLQTSCQKKNSFDKHSVCLLPNKNFCHSFNDPSKNSEKAEDWRQALSLRNRSWCLEKISITTSTTFQEEKQEQKLDPSTPSNSYHVDSKQQDLKNNPAKCITSSSKIPPIQISQNSPLQKNKTISLAPAFAQSQLKFKITRIMLMLQNTWIMWALENQMIQKLMWLQSQQKSSKKIVKPSVSSNSLAKNLIFKSDIPIDFQSTLTLLEEHIGGVCFSFKIYDWLLLLFSFGLSASIGYLLHNDWILGCLVHGCLRWIIELHTTGTLLAREMIVRNFTLAP